MLWKLRTKKGDVQCTVTSVDGKEIYGFCGVRHTAPKTTALAVDFFKKYENLGYKTQVKKIILLSEIKCLQTEL